MTRLRKTEIERVPIELKDEARKIKRLFMFKTNTPAYHFILKQYKAKLARDEDRCEIFKL